ncbi:MAG: hypothetical protein P8X85_07145 [Desulfobacterales bacterium]
MQHHDRIYFSNFAADPEFESIYEYDELYDFEFNENQEKPEDELNFDDAKR